jgi:hypothetical protein
VRGPLGWPRTDCIAAVVTVGGARAQVRELECHTKSGGRWRRGTFNTSSTSAEFRARTSSISDSMDGAGLPDQLGAAYERKYGHPWTPPQQHPKAKRARTAKKKTEQQH